jgi:hypothetical protein
MQLRDKILDLQNVCKIVSKLKSQIIGKLPHYGHDALFLKNDDITTGLLNNTTEIKINLVTKDLLYFHNEKGYIVYLTREDIYDGLKDIGIKYNINSTNF